MKKGKELFQQLFNEKGKEAAHARRLWIGIPVLLWVIVGFSYVYINRVPKAKKKGSKASIAGSLQKDINFIATQTKASDLLAMSKKELIKSDTEDNFLMKKVKRSLERSDYAKSMGTKDDIPITFDDHLNPSVNPNTTANLTANQDKPIQAISASVDSASAMQEVNYALAKISTSRPSHYEYLEVQRKDRLAAAKAANKQRREAIEHSTLDIEAAAYRRGIEEQNQRYAAFHTEEDNKQITKKQRHPSSRKGKKTKKGKSPKLEFDTNTGRVDDLGLKKKEEERSLPTTPLPLTPNYLNGSSKNKPMYALIDRQQKLKSGDKVRLRVTEGGEYKGYLIHNNQILYGICSVGTGRINIRVSSIHLAQQVLPAALEVYDLDGMPGIYIERTDIDIGKEAIQEGLREAGSLGIRNPLGNLSLRLGRKANKNSAARIPPGYQVLLYDRSLK